LFASSSQSMAATLTRPLRLLAAFVHAGANLHERELNQTF
jgi:hypothetical protein